MWDPIAKHGGGTTTGHCTLPGVSRVTFGSDSCKFYVRSYGAGFDYNVALKAFQDMKAGKGPQVGSVFRPRIVDGDALRKRSARWGGR
jgi:hypothetical protein